MSTYHFDEHRFIQAVVGTRIQTIAPALIQAVHAQSNALKHGHLERWETAVNALPSSDACRFNIENGAIRIDISVATDVQKLSDSLKALMPWRKGPYQIGSVHIDTEWRSDWKWNRLLPHISPISGRNILDVGCGSGYHMWRMRHEGAEVVLGIDPNLLYVKQFDAVQHFIQDNRVLLLPLPMQSVPTSCALFDSVFSMGVLYHRRDPHQHLLELHGAVAQDGELILETLVAPGSTNDSTVIDGRYANMRNIYELPTVKRLCHWIEKAGFSDPIVADVNHTSRLEQRSTQWMRSFSLAQALDPCDSSQTIEGFPRPLRAIVVATKRRAKP